MTLEQPAGEMWQKIREELNENQATKDQDLAHIKEWLKQEPHLPDEFGEKFSSSIIIIISTYVLNFICDRRISKMIWMS